MWLMYIEICLIYYRFLTWWIKIFNLDSRVTPSWRHASAVSISRVFRQTWCNQYRLLFCSYKATGYIWIQRRWRNLKHISNKTSRYNGCYRLRSKIRTLHSCFTTGVRYPLAVIARLLHTTVVRYLAWLYGGWYWNDNYYYALHLDLFQIHTIQHST